MNWEKYSQRFREKGRKDGLNEETISLHLDYAKKLHLQGLPIIFNIEHLSLLVGYSVDYIERSISNPYFFYRHYKIAKKNGKLRSISEPLPSLKEIQKWILIEILYKYKVSKYAKAYVKNRSLKSNALFHKQKDAILTIDIIDFFGSIRQSKVYELFKCMGYNHAVSDILSELCTLSGSLPQGAPTSPYISNLVSLEMDNIIGEFCNRRDINFTRYSDDLTFSGNKSIGNIIPFMEKVLSNFNFEINQDKLRIRRSNEAQEVTGIIVNKKLQAPKKMRKNFRQAVHYIKLYGIENHLNHIGNKKKNYLNHLMGIGNFICFINPKDVNARSDLIYLKNLKKNTL